MADPGGFVHVLRGCLPQKVYYALMKAFITRFLMGLIALLLLGQQPARADAFDPHDSSSLSLDGEDSQGRVWFTSMPDIGAQGFIAFDGRNWTQYRVPPLPYPLPHFEFADSFSPFFSHSNDPDVLYQGVRIVQGEALFEVDLGAPDKSVYQAYYHLHEGELRPRYPLLELPGLADRDPEIDHPAYFGHRLIPEAGRALSLLFEPLSRQRYYRWNGSGWQARQAEYDLLKDLQDPRLPRRHCGLAAIDQAGRKWYACPNGQHAHTVLVDQAGLIQVFEDFRFDGVHAEGQIWASAVRPFDISRSPDYYPGRILLRDGTWQAEILVPPDAKAWSKQADGSMIYGDSKGEIYRSAQAGKPVTKIAKLGQDPVLALGYDREGVLWAADRGRIWAIDPGGKSRSWRYHSPDEVLPTINKIFVDSRNHKWFSFASASVMRREDFYEVVDHNIHLDTPLRFDGKKWHYVSLAAPADSPDMRPLALH